MAFRALPFFISLARGRGLGCEGGADLGGLSFYSCPTYSSAHRLGTEN